MQSIHGIMGSPEPNWISQVRPPPDCKYTHSTTPGLRVIGCCVAVPRSHWSAVPTPLFIFHFLYLSNPPSGNLRPIIPCISTSLAQFLPPLLLLTAACLCSHILSLFTLVTTDCNYCGPAFNRFEEMDKYCKFASTFLNYKQNDVDK